MKAYTLVLILGAIAVTLPGEAGQSSLLDRAAPFENGWRITAIDHFDITFTSITSVDLERVARSAERAYRQVGAGLTHELSLRPLIVVYATRAERQRAISARRFPGSREHLLWALDTPAPEADGDFVHELTHVFAYDIVPRTAWSSLTTWLDEGLAEFQRGQWTDSDVAMMRRLLRTNTLPALRNLRPTDDEEAARVQKIIGHAAVDFLVARGGRAALKRMLVSLGEHANAVDACVAAAGSSEPEFDREFAQYNRTRFAPK